MKTVFICIILVLLAVLMITVLKALAKAASQHFCRSGFIVIPIFNDMERLAVEVKSACWDETFRGARGRKILLVPTEKPDEYTARELKKLTDSFDRLRVVAAGELKDFVIDDTRIFNM